MDLPGLHMDGGAHDIEHVCKIWSQALPENVSPQSRGDDIFAGAITSLIKRRLPGRAWERSRQPSRSVGK